MPRAKQQPPSVDPPRPAPGRDKEAPRSVAFVLRLRPSEHEHLGVLARDHGLTQADLIRRRLFDWQLPRPQVDLQMAQQYAVLHTLALSLRNAVSNLNGLARAYHSGLPVEGQELLDVIAQVRGQVDALGREFGGPE